MPILATQDGAPVQSTNPLPVTLYDAAGAPIYSTRRLAADALANPTAPDVLAANLVFNGTTWDRMRAFATGLLRVGLSDTAGNGPVHISASGSDAFDFDAVYRLGAYASNYGYNGSTWERQRQNTEATALTSAARTAATQSADITNHNARGILVWLNITAASGTGGLVLRVQAKGPTSGEYVNLNAATAALTATGTYTYLIYPGSGAAAGDINQVTSAPLPRTWRIAIAVGDASSYTYSVGYALTL